MKKVVYFSEAGAQKTEEAYREVLSKWPVPLTQLTVKTRQGPTFVAACGPEHAPPLLLFHGSQANSAAWFGEAGAWASDYRVYAVDMIGEPGFSAGVRPDMFSEAYAHWLDDVFEGLGITKAALVGTSLGGWLALDYAMRRPASVQALALLCPAGIGRQKNFLLAIAPLLLLGPFGMHKIREKVFGPAPKILPPNLKAISTLMDIIGRTVRPRVIKIPQLSDQALQQLRAPLLVVIGGKDALIDSVETQARLHAHQPHAEVDFIADGYHLLPDQTERIENFLKRHYLNKGDQT